MVQEYLELRQKYDYFEVKTLVTRMEDLRKALVAHANATMEDKHPAIFGCAAGEIEFSPRGTVATVPDPLVLIQTLVEKFGADVATSVIDIGITSLRKVLSEHELKAYLVDQPGPRSLRAVRFAK